MSEIPEDVLKAAADVWAALPKESGGINAIARAIADERERCLKIARRIRTDAEFYGNTDAMRAASLVAFRIKESI